MLSLLAVFSIPKSALLCGIGFPFCSASQDVLSPILKDAAFESCIADRAQPQTGRQTYKSVVRKRRFGERAWLLFTSVVVLESGPGLVTTCFLIWELKAVLLGLQFYLVF